MHYLGLGLRLLDLRLDCGSDSRTLPFFLKERGNRYIIIRYKLISIHKAWDNTIYLFGV